MTAENGIRLVSQNGAQEVDEALLAEVQHVVHELTKTLKIFRTYPKENTISINAIDELLQTFSEYLGEHQILELFVDRHELQWRGVVVYSEPDQRRSFALKLDRDGVRRMVFQEGITGEEVLGLLEALTTDTDEESLEDDLVTVLWDKQLSHVKVYVLDDLSDDEQFNPDLVDAAESDTAAEGAAAIEGSSMGSTPGPAPGPAAPEDGSLDPAPQTALCTGTKAKIHPITDEQAESLRKTSEDEDSHDISTDLTDILFDILRSETQDQVYLNTLKVLVELALMHVKNIAFGRAADIVGVLRAFATDDDTGKDVQAHIVEQLQSLGGDACMATIVETLREHEGINVTELSRFLMMLPADAAPHLCEVMELERYDEVVRTAVRHLVKDDPTVLTSKLAGANVDMAVKVLTILEQVADPDLAQALVDPLGAAETPVKKASVRLLERLKNAPSRDLLLEYVTSEDPGLRKGALRALSSFGELTGPATPLRQQVAFKDFDDRTLEEKKTLLVTLARLESHHAIDFLVDILDDRKWFEKTGHAETRACAALALGETDDDRARNALDRHLNDKSELVRTAIGLVRRTTEKVTAAAGR